MSRDLSMYSAIVVDDEASARTHTAFLLRQAGLGRVHQASGGAECLQILQEQEDPTDWAFVDIQMPEMDGFALADAIRAWRMSVSGTPRPPSVVFVTGYDDYAITAFEHAVVDYLLKPVERHRLDVALDHLVELSGSERPPAKLPAPALQVLPVRLDYAVRLIPIQEIVAAVAKGKRVEVVTRETVYPTYYTLNDLEQRLPADQFLRVHDGTIVNLAEILEIHNLGAQAYQLRLRHESRLLPVSRRRLPALRERLGL